MTKITNDEKEAFTKNLSLEIGQDLAQSYSYDLFQACNNDLEQAIEIQKSIGQLWTPILIHWSKWIKKNALHEPFLIMRDAKPLTVLPETKEHNQLFLNRENCGISDELANINQSHVSPLVMEYINQWGLARQSFHIC